MLYDFGDYTLNTFQSTLLMRGATIDVIFILSSIPRFQSTLLMRGATPGRRWPCGRPCISIHAPHARSDLRSNLTHLPFANFNPRSSCEERPGAAG